MSQMDSVGIQQRVYFDAEDRPPPSYWNKETLNESTNRARSNSVQSLGNTSTSKTFPKISKIDPQEWLKAPEFVPRSRQLLAESFRNDTKPVPNYIPDGTMMPTLPTNGFTNMLEPNAPPPFSTFSPTIIDMPQPVFPSHGAMGFPLPHPARYPLPRSLGLIRFPMPRIAPAPFLIRPPLGFVPPGYSANITQINAGMGPPIPALVLKKKRRKRHRRLKEFSCPQPEKESSNSVHPIDPNGYLSDGDDISTRESNQLRLQLASSEPDLAKNIASKQPSEESGNIEGSLLHGSCPDLSDSQLQLWDNLLYNAVVDEQNRLDSEANNLFHERSTSRPDDSKPVEYEIASRAVLSAMDSALHADGICSKEIRRLDKQLQGKEMEDSFCEEQLIDRLRDNVDNRFVDSPASTTKSLKAEIEELAFRPTISQYGYPQCNPMRVHMATFNPDYNTTTSTIVDRKEQGYVEDCFEGMHIRVNTFDEGDELALSDSELPQPSRFQQIQWALQRGKEQYIRLVPPERVCCTIM